MAFVFKLEQADGTPADPPSLNTAVPDWRPGNTSPLGGRTLHVIGTRLDADDDPVLVVEDTGSSGH